MEDPANPRVLVADDDADILKLVERRLTHRGFDIRTAASGDVALRSALEDPPDAVVLDWLMPGMEGSEVCRALRDDDRTRFLPVILLTAKAADSDQRDGLEAGADILIVKPFNIDELDDALRRLITAPSSPQPAGPAV